MASGGPTLDRRIADPRPFRRRSPPRGSSARGARARQGAGAGPCRQHRAGGPRRGSGAERPGRDRPARPRRDGRGAGDRERTPLRAAGRGPRQRRPRPCARFRRHPRRFLAPPFGPRRAGGARGGRGSGRRRARGGRRHRRRLRGLLPAGNGARSRLALRPRFPPHRHGRNLRRGGGRGQALRARGSRHPRRLRRGGQPGGRLAAVSGERRLEQALAGGPGGDERSDRGRAGGRGLSRRERADRGAARALRRLYGRRRAGQGRGRPRHRVRDDAHRREALSRLSIHPCRAGRPRRPAARGGPDARERQPRADRPPPQRHAARGRADRGQAPRGLGGGRPVLHALLRRRDDRQGLVRLGRLRPPRRSHDRSAHPAHRPAAGREPGGPAPPVRRDAGGDRRRAAAVAPDRRSQRRAGKLSERGGHAGEVHGAVGARSRPQAAPLADWFAGLDGHSSLSGMPVA